MEQVKTRRSEGCEGHGKIAKHDGKIAKFHIKKKKKENNLKIVLHSRIGMHVDDLNTFRIDVLHLFGTSRVISLHKITKLLPAVTTYFWRETCTWKKKKKP